ncbi:MAG: chemotaxis protein, partial [Zoogloea sp.]|nr:chemotaxis protein [Zoogloea sp.]
MKILFAPAVAMLNRMRYPAKFTLLGSIAFLVIGFLLFQLAVSLRENVDFAEKEEEGLLRVPLLLKVIQLSQQHRGLSAGVLNGNEAMAPALQKKAGELAAAVKDAERALATVSSPTAVKSWQEVSAGWAALQSGGLQMKPRDNLFAHTALIRKAIQALHDLGDENNLTLDPSADSYYLIDNVTRRVPDVSERLGRLRAM